MTVGQWPQPKVDHAEVIARYQEIHSLAQTGREFGISRERVRQIVNRAGIDSARIVKSKPQKPTRLCKECGAPARNNHASYCEIHGTVTERNKRRYERMKADPERYAHWRELCRQSGERRKERLRSRSLSAAS
jgi:hypothetical protein